MYIEVANVDQMWLAATVGSYRLLSEGTRAVFFLGEGHHDNLGYTPRQISFPQSRCAVMTRMLNNPTS